MPPKCFWFFCFSVTWSTFGVNTVVLGRTTQVGFALLQPYVVVQMVLQNLLHCYLLGCTSNPSDCLLQSLSGCLWNQEFLFPHGTPIVEHKPWLVSVANPRTVLLIQCVWIWDLSIRDLAAIDWQGSQIWEDIWAWTPSRPGLDPVTPQSEPYPSTVRFPGSPSRCEYATPGPGEQKESLENNLEGSVTSITRWSRGHETTEIYRHVGAHMALYWLIGWALDLYLKNVEVSHRGIIAGATDISWMSKISEILTSGESRTDCKMTDCTSF